MCGWWDSNPHPIKDGFLDRCVDHCTTAALYIFYMGFIFIESNSYPNLYMVFVGITGFEPIISASEANVLTNYTTYPNNTSILRLVTHNPCHFRGLLVFLDC